MFRERVIESAAPEDRRRMRFGDRVAIPWGAVDELRAVWFGRALRAGLQREDAEDLFQESLLAALHGIHRLRMMDERGADEAFLAWFWGILRHKLISELRRRKQVRGKLAARASERRRGDADGALVTRVRSSLGMLERSSPEGAWILRRRFLEGRELSELASDLGVSVPTAWRRVQAALAEIRGCIEVALS